MKKTGFFIYIALFFLTIVLALTCLLQISTPTTGKPKFNNYSHYFNELYEENNNFGNLAISDIHMLGSHDALSDNINYNSKINTNEDETITKPLICGLAKGMIVRFARAQYNNVYDQLVAGSRYLDVRVTELDGQYYSCHALISDYLEISIKQVIRFLDENPGEFVIFHIQHYYKQTATNEDLEDYIESVKYADKSLFDFVNYGKEENDLSSLTYNEVTNNGQKGGIVFYSSLKTVENKLAPFINPISSEWHNKTNIDEMIPDIRETVEESKSLTNHYLRINQTQVTFNNEGLSTAIMGWSLLELAKKSNYKVINLPDIKQIIEALPIYMCDYVTYNNNGFNDKAIALLKEANLNLI